MKRLSLHHIVAWTLLVILGFIVVHAPMTVYISSHWPQYSDIAKAWKEMLMVLAAILLVVLCTRQRAWGWIIRDRLLLLMLGFIALHLAVVVVLHLPFEAVVAGLMIDLRFIAYFIMVYILVRLYPAYKQSFITVGICGAIIVVGFAVLQLVLPHDFLAHFGYGKNTIEPYLTIDKNPDFVRQNSTLRGPNPLGAYAIIVVAAAITYGMYTWGKLRTKWQRIALVAIGLAGLVALVVSYSRSAWIGAVIAVGIACIIRYRAWFTSRRLGLIAVAIVIMGILGYGMRNTYFVQNILLHNNPTTGAVVDSNEGHLSSLKNGFENSVSKPLGNGVGSTGSASLYTNSPVIVENQFLFISHEVGWPGLAIFTATIVVVLVRLWRKRKQWLALALFGSGIGLVIVGFMLPVWVDDTVSIVWWGLAAAVVATSKEAVNGRSTNQKAKRTT